MRAILKTNNLNIVILHFKLMYHDFTFLDRFRNCTCNNKIFGHFLVLVFTSN
jgi:hypothetical protein